jgi:hypothetical protein
LGYNHAEGLSTKALGSVSHAEGSETQALGTRSHAEGIGSIAGGVLENGKYVVGGAGYGHAEGERTKSLSQGAHSEGGYTEARGSYAHAGGFGTQTTVRGQYAIGECNATRDDAAFIVGNGSATLNNSTKVLENVERSNAFAVLKNGRIVLGEGSFGYTLPDTLEENALFFLLEEPEEVSCTVTMIDGWEPGLRNRITVPRGTTWKEYLDAIGVHPTGYDTYTESEVLVYVGAGNGGRVEYNGVVVLPTDVIHHDYKYSVRYEY